MDCPSCRKSIGADAVFCKYCGVEVAPMRVKLLAEMYIEPETQEHPSALPVAQSIKKIPQPSIWESIKGLSSLWDVVKSSSGVVRVILLFIGLNVILWGAQELYYWGDSQKMGELDTQITSMDSQIKSIESFPNTTTQSQYESLINKRNKAADEYNALVKSSGTRWYLIPIPLGGHSLK